MAKKSKITSLSLSGTNILKTIAILAVFLIHTLSSIKPSPFVTESPYQLIAVTLDQLSRISVPLFVALSGYGLYYKYSNIKLSLISFFNKRFSKLLPLYVFWSAFFYILFFLVPSWGPSTPQPNFIWQLLLGRADYHLYFVPMIFQLYLFFPIILKVFKKWPLLTLLSAVAIQLVWWWIFSYGGKTVTSWKYFADDGEQYLWATNWIAYFVLGMYLPKLWEMFDRKKLTFISLSTIWIASTVYTIYNAVTAINTGLDPLYALKFTRYPLFVYSSLAIIVTSYIVAKIKTYPNWMVYIGKISYPLYLSHTFFLRVAVFLAYFN